MKLKVLTTCDNPKHEGYLRLKASLDKFGYDHEVIVHPFSFGHQLPVIRDWCNRYTGDATHILYTDAFDTLAFAGLEEIENKLDFIFYYEYVGWVNRMQVAKMLISCEKNCYPHPERAGNYPETSGPWKYVNGGGWIAEIEYFKQLCIKENLNDQSHDQVWLMEAFLNNQQDIKLDTNCEIFQTIAFSHKEEWDSINEHGYGENRFRNIGTSTFPVFFHGNGHTDMGWLMK